MLDQDECRERRDGTLKEAAVNACCWDSVAARAHAPIGDNDGTCDDRIPHHHFHLTPSLVCTRVHAYHTITDIIRNMRNSTLEAQSFMVRYTLPQILGLNLDPARHPRTQILHEPRFSASNFSVFAEDERACVYLISATRKHTRSEPICGISATPDE